MRPMIVGNWKMHGDGGWLPRLEAIAVAAAASPDVDVALCVPATLVHRAATLAPDLTIGGQDCHQAAAGAHTGSISPTMLYEAGARLVILGHSERRSASDPDAVVAKKVASAQAAGLRVLLCVGDTGTVSAQLRASLPPVVEDLIVAYEPVWAIGTGRTPTIEQIASVVSDLRSTLTEHGIGHAPILYGGSVTTDVSRFLLSAVDGLLVGSASLDTDTFGAIIKLARPIWTARPARHTLHQTPNTAQEGASCG